MENAPAPRKVVKTHVIGEVLPAHLVVSFVATEICIPAEVDKALNEIFDVAQEIHRPIVIINFTRLRRLSSAFIGKLVGLHKKLEPLKIKLRLCCMARDVEDAYKICNLQKLIPLFPSQEAATKP